MNEPEEKFEPADQSETEPDQIAFEEDKTFQSAQDIYAMPSDEQRPFRSRFKKWMRTVSLIIILTFLPEQASWAFNYNPLVLWGNQLDKQYQQAETLDPAADQEQVTASQIAQSVGHLLG